MTESKDGQVFMTTEEVERDNARVVLAWDEKFLGYNMPHLVKLSNKKHTLLWPELIKVDVEDTMEGKLEVMKNIYQSLTEK